LLLVGALSLAIADVPRRAGAQPGAMNDFPTSAQSLFGKKKDNREVSGPTLSATDEPVAEIRVVGNKTIPTAKILNELQTRVGRPYDPALVQRDMRKLASKGWFVDVQPSYEQAPGGRIVVFKVTERPIVRYVEYLGNVGLRTKKIDKETGLKVGGPIDPYAVQEAKRKIIDLYHRNGYNNAQVNILEGEKQTDTGIVFVINEGEMQKIWKVEFVGNEFISERRLKTKIDSKPPILMLFKGYVDEESIEADKNKLIAFYRSFGFFQAKIGTVKEFDEKNKWMTLQFVISEGPRYQVESIAFIGNKIFSSDSLTQGVEMKPDPKDRTVVQKMWHTVKPLSPGPQPFEQDRMNADVAWLKELYGSQGYIFADVEAEPVFLEEVGKLRLTYHIKEGRRWRVGNIYVHINGDNPHTKIQTALNRLSFKSGQIADIREIRASERRLQASGLFMTDPVRGVAPKITYHIPEVGDKELANREGGNFRGQSPDGQPRSNGGGFGLMPADGLPEVVDEDGPPLIAPPQTSSTYASPAVSPEQLPAYKIQSPQPSDRGDDLVDVHYYFENDAVLVGTEPAASTPPQSSAAPATASPPATAPFVRSVYSQPSQQPAALPSTAQRYEARRFPIEEYPQPVQQTTPPAAWANRPTYPTGQVQSASGPQANSSYQRLVVRTQSPYQGATTPAYSQPAAAQQSAATGYATNAYGGQTVGATGPNAVTAGGTSYPVRPAAITEPYIPQSTTETLPTPPGYAPAPQPIPQGAPAPAYGAPAPYCPPGTVPASLMPDPNITPVAPLPTQNPQPMPPTPYDPFTQPFVDPGVDMDVVVSEGQTGRIMLGVAVNSDAGLVGQILFDEQNFDIARYPRTWDDFVSGRAWRGAGQRLRLEAAPGTQVQRYLANFTEQNVWDTDWSLGLSGSFFTRRYQDWDEQRLGGRVSFGYAWVENDLSTAVSYRGEDVKISNPSTNTLPALNEVVGSNAIHGFKWTIANDTRDSAFLATEGHYLGVELEQVIGSFQYPRAVFDGRQYLLMSERPDHSGRHVVTLSTRLGFSGTDTPIFENFFAGGFSTLRGFEFRGASPVEQNVQVGGRFEWINTVEYLFPITADDMIHGVAFCDFGTVEQNVSIHSDTFRVAPGLGLRITVPAMGPAPIALDFAFPVAKADTDETQVFSFNIGLQR